MQQQPMGVLFIHHDQHVFNIFSHLFYQVRLLHVIRARYAY